MILFSLCYYLTVLRSYFYFVSINTTILFATTKVATPLRNLLPWVRQILNNVARIYSLEWCPSSMHSGYLAPSCIIPYLECMHEQCQQTIFWEFIFIHFNLISAFPFTFHFLRSFLFIYLVFNSLQLSVDPILLFYFKNVQEFYFNYNSPHYLCLA